MTDAKTIIKDWCAAAGMPEPSDGECYALEVALQQPSGNPGELDAQDREDARRWLDKLINLIVTYGDQRHFEVEAADKRDAADRSAQAFANIMTHVRAAKGADHD